MKYFIFLILIVLIYSSNVSAQPLERIIQSLPVFVRYSNVKADDGLLIVGVFSDKKPKIEDTTLDLFKNLKIWNHKEVIENVGHKEIKVVSLNGSNISAFKGQVIWVIDAKDSPGKLKSSTKKGIFTIGAQNTVLEESLAASLIFKNKSDDPEKEKWRLTKFIANCEISPLKFANKLKGKNYFASKKCN